MDKSAPTSQELLKGMYNNRGKYFDSALFNKAFDSYIQEQTKDRLLNEKVKLVVMQGIGLSIIIIGVSGAILTQNVLLLVISLALGGAVGSLLKIDDRLDNVGLKIER